MVNIFGYAAIAIKTNIDVYLMRGCGYKRSHAKYAIIALNRGLFNW